MFDEEDFDNNIYYSKYRKTILKVPSSKRWILYDNILVICNYCVDNHHIIISKDKVIKLIYLSMQDGETILDASDRVKKLVRNNDKKTLLKLGIK